MKAKYIGLIILIVTGAYCVGLWWSPKTTPNALSQATRPHTNSKVTIPSNPIPDSLTSTESGVDNLSDNDKSQPNPRTQNLTKDADSKQTTKDIFNNFDDEISKAESTEPPGWFYYQQDIYREVHINDPNSVISDIRCGKNVCRVDVFHSDQIRSDSNNRTSTVSNHKRKSQHEDIKSKLTEAQRIHDDFNTEYDFFSTYYRYPETEPNKTIIYVTKGEKANTLIEKVKSQ